MTSILTRTADRVFGYDFFISYAHADGKNYPRELKKRYGGRLAFWGAIDSQRVLPFGSVEDVRKEVERRIEELGEGGGYVLGAVHNIQPDVPPENIVAMYRHARAYTPSYSRRSAGGNS